MSGVVRAVGPDVEGPAGPVRPGDEVIGFRVDGGYADLLTVPAVLTGHTHGKIVLVPLRASPTVG